MRSRSPLAFWALVISVVMFLIAGSLLLHVWKTNKWLTEIKAQVAAQTLALKSPEFKRTEANACPDQKPVLIGFDTEGKPRCRALSTQACAPGQYLASIDPTTLQIRCADAGATMTCPANSYITEFMWLGANQISFSCIPRLDPFMAWKFEPVLGTKGNDR